MNIQKAFILGDSHTHALKRAIKLRGHSQGPVQFLAQRIKKEKNGTEVGDVSFEEGLTAISDLRSDDLMVAATAGNQYSVIGLIQHPIAFDFYEPNARTDSVLLSSECIPYNILWDRVNLDFERKDGARIRQMIEVCSCPIYYLSAPPPKEDDAYILRRHETAFARWGIAEKGVSPPALRLKLWRLQLEVTRSICSNLGIRLVLPPKRSATQSGFLKPEYYADDATHANAAYGELVLQDLEALASGADPFAQV